MPPESRRRSGRIPKQLAIFLIGSDIEGRIFSEETQTVVLSRHGAGILSQYKLSAEQEVIIRSVDSGKEVEVRVVGQLAAAGDNYIYGVAFLDPELNFWGLDFAELTEAERQANRALLECSNCKTREMMDHSDLDPNNRSPKPIHLTPRRSRLPRCPRGPRQRQRRRRNSKHRNRQRPRQPHPKPRRPRPRLRRVRKIAGAIRAPESNFKRAFVVPACRTRSFPARICRAAACASKAKNSFTRAL